MRGIDGVSGPEGDDQYPADRDRCERVKHATTAFTDGHTYIIADDYGHPVANGYGHTIADGYIHAYAVATHLDAYSGAANSHGHLAGTAPHLLAGAPCRGATL